MLSLAVYFINSRSDFSAMKTLSAKVVASLKIFVSFCGASNSWRWHVILVVGANEMPSKTTYSGVSPSPQHFSHLKSSFLKVRFLQNPVIACGDPSIRKENHSYENIMLFTQ